MNKVLIKRNLIFMRNILLNISEDYVSYEYRKTLSDIHKDTISRNENNLTLIKNHKKL